MAKKPGSVRAQSRREARARNQQDVCPTHGNKVSKCFQIYRCGCTRGN